MQESKYIFAVKINIEAMPIFDGKVKTQLIDLLGDLPEKVNIVFFGSKTNCNSCEDTKQFVSEFSELHNNIKLQIFDFEEDNTLAAELGINKVPSLVILDKDKKDYGLRFYGIPAGYEVHSLISAIREVSGIVADLPEEIENRISKLEKKVHIQVFVTPTCPYCPGAVITGHRLAMLNENVVADMIEANSFPDVSAKYGVKTVPKIVINETLEFVGSQPITKFLDVIEGL